MRKTLLFLFVALLAVSLFPISTLASTSVTADYMYGFTTEYLSTNYRYVGVQFDYVVLDNIDLSLTGKVKFKFTYDEEGKKPIERYKIKLANIKEVIKEKNVDDFDNDGILNIKDNCKRIPGYQLNGGCPFATNNCVQSNSSDARINCKSDTLVVQTDSNTLVGGGMMDLKYHKDLKGKRVYVHAKVIPASGVTDFTPANNKARTWIDLP